MIEHGTPKGYWKHKRRGEKACDSCRAAHSDYVKANRVSNKRVRELSFDNPYTREMDAALAENEPVITWVKQRGGVMRAVDIQDPHTDHRYRTDGAA